MRIVLSLIIAALAVIVAAVYAASDGSWATEYGDPAEIVFDAKGKVISVKGKNDGGRLAL